MRGGRCGWGFEAYGGGGGKTGGREGGGLRTVWVRAAYFWLVRVLLGGFHQASEASAASSTLPICMD